MAPQRLPLTSEVIAKQRALEGLAQPMPAEELAEGLGDSSLGPVRLQPKRRPVEEARGVSRAAPEVIQADEPVRLMATPDDVQAAGDGVTSFLEKLRSAGEASPTAKRILEQAGPKTPAVDVSKVGAMAMPQARGPISAPMPSNEQEGVSTPATVPQERPPISTSGDSEYAAAQRQGRDIRLSAAIGRAGAGINKAISGADYDAGAYDDIENGSGRPVAELVAQRDADKRKRLEDPTSQESRRFQAAVMKAMGGVYSPEEVAGMSAADEPFVAQYGVMAQRLAERREAATQEDMMRRAAMERQDAQRAEERTYQERQAGAGRSFQAGEAAKQRAFQREMAGMNNAADLQQAQARAGATSIERDVQKVGEDLDGAGTLKGDLDYLDQQAAKEDVPGVGKWDSRKTGLMSVFASDDDTRTLQTMRGVVGRLLKERSGTAASDAEVERVMTELGMGPGSSEQEFKVGLTRLRQDVARALGTKQARYRPEVVQTYKERGGTLASDIAPAPRALTMPDGSQWAEGPDGQMRRVN